MRLQLGRCYWRDFFFLLSKFIKEREALSRTIIFSHYKNVQRICCPLVCFRLVPSIGRFCFFYEYVFTPGRDFSFSVNLLKKFKNKIVSPGVFSSRPFDSTISLIHPLRSLRTRVARVPLIDSPILVVLNSILFVVCSRNFFRRHQPGSISLLRNQLSSAAGKDFLILLCENFKEIFFATKWIRPGDFPTDAMHMRQPISFGLQYYCCSVCLILRVNSLVIFTCGV